MLSQRVAVSPDAARCVIDYTLARRNALADLAAGRSRTADVCDAQAYLRRAARYHGEAAGVPCPVCADDRLLHVTYAYGDSLGADGSGRARHRRELDELASTVSDFSVHVVEVCSGCGWNHLVLSYVLGTGEPTPARRRRS